MWVPEMADQVVEVTIAPDGKVTLHVTGVDGMACLSVTMSLGDLLGGTVEAQELTAEAYVEAVDEQERLNWT